MPPPLVGNSRRHDNINAGVPAPEIARRAGHGVAVLLRVYAGYLSGHDQLWSIRIDDVLRESET
jgi:hypothetical protein